MNPHVRALAELLQQDPRFKLEAYQFVREALTFAQDVMKKSEGKNKAVAGEESAHLTGQELCEACRQYALQQYGYLAKIVLENWGIHSTSDFGEIVYNLIRIKQMRKSPTDRREDFDGIYSFDDAFQPDFAQLASPASKPGA
jgi:uncharacterized repeat protein (TIGR04138 family)